MGFQLLLIKFSAFLPVAGDKNKKSCIETDTAFLLCGATRNRTGDTRIFSPLLYQLSYGTNVFLNAGAKILLFSVKPTAFGNFFTKSLAFP